MSLAQSQAQTRSLPTSAQGTVPEWAGPTDFGSNAELAARLPAVSEGPSLLDEAEARKPTGIVLHDTLRRGARGDNVQALQAFLGVEPDGVFGKDTQAAVIRWQRSRGLDPDGVVGRQSRAALSRGPTQPERPAAPAKAPAPVTAPAAETAPVPTEGPTLSPEVQQQHLSEIGDLLGAEWGALQVGRDKKTDETSAKLVQRALVELGYLEPGTAIDGQWGARSTNALMAFQVASSGVDTVEKGQDEQGRPLYLDDGDAPRLKGIVTGKLDASTRKKLLAELEGRKDAILRDGRLPELKVMHELGDSPEQQAELDRKVREMGVAPETLRTVDVNAYRELGLRPHVLAAAVDGWRDAALAGSTRNTVVTVNDYELPANMRRSFTIDLAKAGAAPLLHQVVAHGSGSDNRDGSGVWSTKFSRAQRDNSHQSMLGSFVSGGQTYEGSKISGTHVEGLEKGRNDRAAPRLIRTHAPTKDTWTSDSVIGRDMSYHSQGCFVMDRAGAASFKEMTEKAGGTHVFNFAPHEQYWKDRQTPAAAPAPAPARPGSTFTPRFQATAYSESAKYRTKSDPYAVGAITRPDPKEDLGGKTYGTYQFESSVYPDGSRASKSAVDNSTVMRFVRAGDNPYSAELSAVVREHGVASTEFDAAWRELTARDNQGFGQAQERFMEAELTDKVNAWMDLAGISGEARKDPRLFDVVMGTLNQYGELAPAMARHLAASEARTADELGAALQQHKRGKVTSNFKSSPKAHPGIYARIDREGAMFEGYRPPR